MHHIADIWMFIPIIMKYLILQVDYFNIRKKKYAIVD